jgi:hypothetical protein
MTASPRPGPPRPALPAAALLLALAACASVAPHEIAESVAAPSPRVAAVAEADYRPLSYVHEERTIGCGVHYSAAPEGYVRIEGSVNAFYDTGQAPSAMIALTVLAAAEGMTVPVPVVSAWLVTAGYGPTRDFRRLTYEDVPTFLAVNTQDPDALFLPADLVEGFRVAFVVSGAPAATVVDLPPFPDPEPYLTVDACLRELFTRLDTDMRGAPAPQS